MDACRLIEIVVIIDVKTIPPGSGSGGGGGGGIRKLGRFNEDDLFSDPVFSSSGKENINGGRGGAKKPSRTGRFKIIGDSRKSASLERGEEMKYNPKVD
jgi:hypothetical protein